MGTEDDPPDELGRGTMAASMWKHTSGTAESDWLQGNEATDDPIHNHGGNDALHGGAGDETRAVGDDNDIFDSGSEDDILYGGDGDDHLDGGAVYDALFGGLDDDTYFSFSGENDIDDSAGDIDFISGNQGGDQLFGGDGDDEIIGEADPDIIDGGTGIYIPIGRDAGSYELVEDVFVFDFGDDHDVVTDIDARIDTTDLSGAGDFDLLGLSTRNNGVIDQSGAETVITDGSNATITLENVQASGFGADDFWF